MLLNPKYDIVKTYGLYKIMIVPGGDLYITLKSSRGHTFHAQHGTTQQSG